MKILHLVGVMNRAGLETFIMNMYRNINKDLYSFDFLCLHNQKGDYDKEINHLGGNIYHTNLKHYGGVKGRIENYHIIKLELSKYINTHDILHIHNYHAFDSYVYAKAALAAGFKNVIVHSHSTNAEYHKKLHFLFRPFLNKLNINKLACSTAAGEWLFGEKNIKVISNGINTANYKFNSQIRNEYRKKFNLSDDFVIGHVGRFEYVKNQIFLCKIANRVKKEIPNAKFVFVGEGIELDNIKEYCRKYNIENVIFLGVRDDVNNIYQAFDLFVFPSIFEGIPLSIIEAETSGLPCIVSTGVPDGINIVNNVFHIDLNDTENWIRKISEINKLHIDRTNNYNIIIDSGYDINNSVHELEKFYSKVNNGGI